MDYRRAFKLMLEEKEISGAALSRQSRVQERQISTFLNGKDLRAETFFKLLEAAETLHPGAKACFYSHTVPVPILPSPERLVQQMNPTDISRLLQAIATRIDDTSTAIDENVNEQSLSLPEAC